MLDKIKDLGAQAASKTHDAIDGVTSSVKEGFESLTSTASTMTGALNEKAVRASTSQMYRILEIALEELNRRPLAERPISLTSTVNFGIASLELQIHLNQHAGTQAESTGAINSELVNHSADE
jgi:hypothetical protein